MALSDVQLIEILNQQAVVTGGLVNRGAYAAGTDYAVGDAVSYNGSSYVMYNNGPAGTVPTNATYWQVLASKGDTGATGDAGPAGADGAAGATGPAPAGQIYLSAAGMWQSLTSGSSLNTKAETTTNDVNYYTLDFDPSTQEYAEGNIVMPSDWDGGNITATFYWTHGATTTNFGVVWSLSALALGNDEALDTAYGTAQLATDTGGTAGNLYVTSATSAITVGGTPAASKLVQFKVSRVVANAADTLAVDAKLLGVMIAFTRS